MVEIYLKNGLIYEVDEDIRHVRTMIENDFIKQVTFISFLLPDGTKAYIKKNEIVSFNEIEKECV